MDFQVNPIDYDNTCYIIGGGPSLKDFDWNLLGPDKFVIVINRAYEVLPNAQIIYYTDKDYEDRHLIAMRQHKGQLMRGILPSNKDPKHPDVIYWKLTGVDGYETTPGCLKHGSNSTHAAVNMCAAHLGFKRIYLLGVDMQWGIRGNKNTSHFHDGHKRIDPESGYTRMIRHFNVLAHHLEATDVQVYNVNPSSALECFPKITVEQMLQGG